jgi:peptidoglycan-N-acetylglucosamine deacetylase
MADYLLTASALAVLAAAALTIWRRFGGSPRSLSRAIARIAVALALAIVMVGGAVYALSKSRTLQLVGRVEHRLPTSERVVAITFDDGPTPAYTERILGELGRRNVPATFYLTGEECERYPEQLSKVVASGNEIGNHTYSHGRMLFMPDSRIAEEIERTDTAIRGGGYRGPITFRPPGCKRLLSTPLYLERTGRVTVTWDLEPDSFKGVESSSGAIVDYVMARVRPGSIVELHGMYASREPTLRALPELLDRLSEAGYRFATVSQIPATGTK